MLIENCVFEHGEYSPRFLFASEMDFTERENYYHRNIQVKNCIFRGAGELARLSHVDGFTAENNRFDEGSFLTAQSCGRIGSDIPVREENK